MKAQFKNNYFTGNYASIGDLAEAIEVQSLPSEADPIKLQCYQYINGEWMFDKKQYAKLTSQTAEKDLEALKMQRILESKNNLSEYLSSHKLKSSCHGGTEKEYSITPQKQSYLSSMLLTATMAEQSDISYQPSWNASGEPSTADWTIEELQQLTMEIEAIVRPLILKQQQLEVSIREAATRKELVAIDITF